MTLATVFLERDNSLVQGRVERGEWVGETGSSSLAYLMQDTP